MAQMGVTINSFALWAIACKARDRSAAETFSTDATIAIIMSAASCEGFINELTEVVLFSKRFSKVSEQLASFADVLEEIERSRGSVLLKYLMASLTLSGKRFDKGANPFQDFDLLVTLRNEHMHLRPKDTITNSEGGVAVIFPKFITGLQQRGLAHKTSLPNSWLQLVQSHKMADWACTTALNIILAVLAMIPDSGDDPSSVLKMYFRDQREHFLQFSKRTGSKQSVEELEQGYWEKMQELYEKTVGKKKNHPC